MPAFRCNLICDGPASGAWNMALDEALLRAAADEPASGVWLRFYAWAPATLSLGYFQRLEQRQDHPHSSGLAVVRRPSGGGAIVHDQELTYSLVVPADHPLAARPAEMYRGTHGALVSTLATLGIAAELHEADAAADTTNPPFLCFLRRGSGDLLLRGQQHRGTAEPGGTAAKIAGSAQRRRQGAILQHGSILLAQSKSAPELPGISELSGLAVAAAELQQQWTKALGQSLGLRMQTAEASQQVRHVAESLREEKYAARSWTERR